MKETKKNEFRMRCFSCKHSDAETSNDVSCCNLCGECFNEQENTVYDFYEPSDDEEYYDWGYESNMPCDNTGYCAGTSCSQYFECQGK